MEKKIQKNCRVNLNAYWKSGAGRLAQLHIQVGILNFFIKEKNRLFTNFKFLHSLLVSLIFVMLGEFAI
jgi:hypothetical protein